MDNEHVEVDLICIHFMLFYFASQSREKERERVLPSIVFCCLIVGLCSDSGQIPLKWRTPGSHS